MNHTGYYLILFCCLTLSCAAPRVAVQNETQNPIHHVLCGAVASRQATLSIQTMGEVSFQLSVREQGSGKMVFSKKIKTSGDPKPIQTILIKGLNPHTPYQYFLNGPQEEKWVQGRFQTFPEKSASYKLVFGSCQNTGSESSIFDQIRQEEALAFMQIGDLHYENIDQNCQPRFDSAYHRIFSSQRQAALYQNTPLIYMWDDHDFGPNNAGADNPCRSTAVRQYKKYFPHYPMAFDEVQGPISQSFEIGRVTYVLADLRSQKIKPQYSDCDRIQPGSNFGSEKHLDWFFQTLLNAKKKGHIVAWISSYSWINAPGGPNYKCAETDNWGGYPEERKRIADFIRKNNIPLFILSGDAHMVAMDDGSHSDYATEGGATIRVFHAAAIDRTGSYKGGPYSEGYSTEEGQYGVIEVKDEGKDQICFSWYAKNKNGKRVINKEGREIKMYFCMKPEN